MSEHNSNDPLSEVGAGPLGYGLDLITEAVAGISIPQPVKLNAFKAFGRLCSAAVEVPAAYFEGLAQEKRAESAARVRLIETNASQIARQMEVDPEYARIAVRKFGQKIIREQVNLDLVSAEAAKVLKESTHRQEPSTEEIGEIDDDWLNQFEEKASQRSSEEMQKLFGRILAGEIRKPSTFSIKSIKILGEINGDAAALFRRFCSACIILQIPKTENIIDARVVSLSGNAASNTLKLYGFSFPKLNLLQEYGLIISDYNSWQEYNVCVTNKENIVALPFRHRKSEWALLPQPGFTEGQSLKLSGVALSRAGQELMKIIDIDPSTEYTQDLCAFFEKRNLKMIPVKENS